MAKVLMLSLVFGPDTVSTANMMTELAQGLQECGHEVTVLTSMPHYNPAQEVLSNPHYRAKLPKLYTDVSERGVRVIRVFMPLKGRKVWRRALDYIWFQSLTLVIGVLKAGRQDVIFVPSPPITLGLNGFLLKVLLHGKMIYDVRELWPDVPVRMGLLKNKLLIRLAYAVENFVYRNSVAITSIARSFNANLEARGVPKKKLYFTPNFVDVEWLKPLPKDNAFAREHGLDNKFVIFYAGNIGLSQGLEILTKVAVDFEADRDVVFLVIGDGAARLHLEQAVKDSGLQNICLLPFQPYRRVPETYATADVSISPMKLGFSYDTVPSKIYTAMAAGRPVVAAAESDTETAMLIQESSAGLVVTPESAQEMIDAIKQLRNSPELATWMGQNARRWVVAHYSKTAVIDAYDKAIRRVAQDTRL
ncbi:MAG TPA: glycosyltransferase family 4 protein [Chloroflexi bacterium]|nr:glycosyltransferase family 4 protein [Chloroflexota bacterium]